MVRESNLKTPGGYFTRFWTGTCHRSFKNIPVPYTNFPKIYTRPCTNFLKMHRYRSLYQNHKNQYLLMTKLRKSIPFLIPKSLKSIPFLHVPVPKICIVHPPGGLKQSYLNESKFWLILEKLKYIWRFFFHFGILVSRVFSRHCADYEAECTPWYTSIYCAENMGCRSSHMDLQFVQQSNFAIALA